MDSDQTRTMFYMQYTYFSVYCTSIVLLSFGLILNIVFIHTISKEEQRKKTRDLTLQLTSVVQCVHSAIMLVKITFVYSSKGNDTVQNGMPVFESLDFLLGGLFIWQMISLNASRFFVIKNIEVPIPNNKVTRSNVLHRVYLLFLLVISVTYGISSCLHISKTPIVKQILQLLAFEFPWTMFLILDLVMAWYIFRIIYRKSQRQTRIQDANISHGQGPNITNKLVQQIVYSMIFQFVFMIIPYSYVISMNFISTNQLTTEVNLLEQTSLYCVIQSIIPILNPIALGLFLKERRKFLASYLNIRKVTDVFSSPQIYPIPHEELQTIPETEELEMLESQKCYRMSKSAESFEPFLPFSRLSSVSRISTGRHLDAQIPCDSIRPDVGTTGSCFFPRGVSVTSFSIMSAVDQISLDNYLETPMTGDSIQFNVGKEVFIFGNDVETDSLSVFGGENTEYTRRITQTSNNKCSQIHCRRISSRKRTRKSAWSLNSVRSNRSINSSSGCHLDSRSSRTISFNSDKYVCSRTSIESPRTNRSLCHSISSVLSNHSTNSTIQDTVLYF